VISVRVVLGGLAIAFVGYLAARGLWWTSPVLHPLAALAALGLYLATALLCILWDPVPTRAATGAPRTSSSAVEPRTGQRLPLWATALALTCALVIPSSVAYAVGPDARTTTFATWYLGGIGALMTIVMVRGRPWVAWIGTVMLAIASMLWMGPAAALALGLVGSIVWVGAAQLLVRSFDKAARDTARLVGLQRAASGWQAAQTVRQRERRVQVQQALSIAGPTLTRTVATGGRLDDADRVEARLAEGRLRDELRGRLLLDDAVRAELDRARRRGATVTLLDEGGLDGVADADLAVIRAELAETLGAAASDRLFIRTSPHDRVAVTVVGRSASGGGLSDEDSVDLWHEIVHPGR
jgi:hypothetical protein